MTFEEYRRYDALGLAQLIRQKEITAAEVVEIATQRAEHVNPKINAIVHPLYDLARKMAGEATSENPFAGVPFLIKDLGLSIQDTPRRTGSKGYEGYVSPENSYAVDRFRTAGLSFLGKTNTPEFGLTPFTEPKHQGPTRNPWNLERSAGGSSGGSAAAVAAGIVPMATASDGGGSIRIPASCCGLFGLKPSRGRVSLGPDAGESWQGAVVEHCVSRSVRDSAALLDAIQSMAPGDPYGLPAPEQPYLEALKTPPGVLRIAFTTQHTLGATLHPECAEAVSQAARLLESLGHRVEEVTLPYRAEELYEVFMTMVAAETYANLRQMGEFLGRPVRSSDVELPTYGLYMLGQSLSAGELAYQKRRWNDISRRMAEFHRQHDLLLTSTVSMPPFKIGTLQPTSTEMGLLKTLTTLRLGGVLKANVPKMAEKIYSYIPYTPFANMTGQPSMSVPLHWTADNLPVGLMFTGPIGREDLLFQLAAQLEEAQPWMEKLAPV